MSKQNFLEDDFLITDPEKHPRVVLEVVAGMKPLRLEPIGYRAETEVRCAFCRNRQRHIYGFFAVMPDGGLALCGNCCAIEIADKSTVAKIKRDVKRREEVVIAREKIALLAVGLSPIIEILERDWLQIEAKIHQHVHRLHECFYSVKPPKMAKLSVVATGLKDIVSAASSGSVSDVRRKRSRAMEMVDEGISELEAERSKLDYNEVRRLVRYDDAVHGYLRTQLDGRSLYLLNMPSWINPDQHELCMDEHMQIPKIHLPDPGPLKQTVEAAKLVAV